MRLIGNYFRDFLQNRQMNMNTVNAVTAYVTARMARGVEGWNSDMPANVASMNTTNDITDRPAGTSSHHGHIPASRRRLDMTARVGMNAERQNSIIADNNILQTISYARLGGI